MTSYLLLALFSIFFLFLVFKLNTLTNNSEHKNYLYFHVTSEQLFQIKNKRTHYRLDELVLAKITKMVCFFEELVT
jgi:hypothetical protein